jgi:hypothetical protein
MHMWTNARGVDTFFCARHTLGDHLPERVLDAVWAVWIMLVSSLTSALPVLAKSQRYVSGLGKGGKPLHVPCW